MQKHPGVNVSERETDHVVPSVNPTAASATHEHPTRSATNHVRSSGRPLTNPRNVGTATSGLKRKHPESGGDTGMVEIPKRKHQKNLPPREHSSVYQSDLHAGVPPLGNRYVVPFPFVSANPRIYPLGACFAGRSGNAVAAFDAIGMSKDTLSTRDLHSARHTIDPQIDQAPITAAVGVPSTAESGTHKFRSIASRRQPEINLTDKPESARGGRKTPKSVPVSNNEGRAREIIDLTLEFSPQLTSTQVAAGPSRKPRSRAEGKGRVSSHATYSPRRDKVIKTTTAADIPTLSNVTPPSLSPFVSNVDTPVARLPPTPPVEPLKPTTLPPPYSSNITTPVNSNSSDRAAIFPSTSTADERSTSETTSRRSKRELMPKTTKPTKGKGKERPALVTPLEYARKLQESLQAAGQKSSKRYPKCLKGKRIFYVGGDMQYAGQRTRNRMEIVGAPFL